MKTNVKMNYPSILCYSIFLACVLILAGCSEKMETDYYRPTGPMTVSLDQTTVSAGTPLKLNFSGMADSVVFYSGKEGHRFEYRYRTKIEGVIPSMSFTSSRRWGYQENTLKLLVSRDFAGSTYSIESINAATWEDLTDLVTLDNNNVNTVFNDVPSGAVDLRPFISETPIVIAFKYNGETGTTQRTWNIKNFFVHSQMPDGTVTELANIATAEWGIIPVLNPNRPWRTREGELFIEGGNQNQPTNEAWAISKPIYLDRIAPDRGEVLKSKYQFMIKEHWFVYDEPGTYNAVLVAKDETGETIHTFEVVVE